MSGQSEPIQAVASGRTSGQVGERLAVVGGLLGAIAASSCCILPLLLFSVGAGGAWIGNLSALAPYQPSFVVITLALVGYGFWLVYRKRTVCAGGDACASPLPSRLVKTGLWTATVIVAAALAFPYAAPVLLGT